ncbi:MAG: reverse transcriptase family protein [Sedimenticola sp.]
MHRREEVKRHVEEMLDHQVIQPSYSPWSSPIVMVPKKDGSTRFCVDYRRLNAVSKKDAYPLPRIDDTLDSLAGAKLFSSLDLVSGYWQVDMDPTTKEKPAFSTQLSLYEFNVLPFGLSGAPGTFLRSMEAVLGGLQWEVCLIYLDDILIFSCNFTEHLDRLKLVLQRLREAKLKVKPQKFHLLQQRVACLGHVISSDGIETDPDKTAAVRSWPVPTTVDELQCFLGFASYYRRFISKFADIASPLHALLQKKITFSWNTACQNSFDELKHRLVTAPVLAFPVAGHQFILDTDASEYGIGGVLSQIVDGQEKVLSYASRSLTKCEKNYCVTRRELLALVYFVKHFKHYLYGQTFVCRTDHKALKWIQNFKEPEGQLARWLTQLAEFSFTVEHREGKKHTNADLCHGYHVGSVAWKNTREWRRCLLRISM